MKPPEDYNKEDQLAFRWIERIQKGDPQGLDSLYALYHRPVLSLVLQVINDRGAAEEILQDVFVRVFRKSEQFDPELGTPFTWVATIGRRMALDYLRKQRRRFKILSAEREQTADSADQSLFNESARNKNEPRKIWMEELFADLSPSQREVLELAFIQGYTHTEIAKALHKPLGTVKSDLRRSLMQLRKHHLGGNE